MQSVRDSIILSERDNQIPGHSVCPLFSGSETNEIR